MAEKKIGIYKFDTAVDGLKLAIKYLKLFENKQYEDINENVLSRAMIDIGRFPHYGEVYERTWGKYKSQPETIECLLYTLNFRCKKIIELLELKFDKASVTMCNYVCELQKHISPNLSMDLKYEQILLTLLSLASFLTHQLYVSIDPIIHHEPKLPEVPGMTLPKPLI